ncbi:MAG: YcaO-like family protein [Bacillota bacterium]
MSADHGLRDAIARGMRLVDDRTGIIQGIYDLPIETNDPKFFHVAAPLTDTLRYHGIRCYRHNGGAALTKDRAVMSAIGESVERYCAGMYDPLEQVEARYRDLDGEAVPPWAFTLFSEKQYQADGFPLSRPSEDTVFRWVKGRSLARDSDVFVPACFVYVPYKFRDRSEAVTAPISTGLACGGTREDAVLRGIYEAVERDSFAITWLNRLPMPRLGLGNPRSAELGAVIERFNETGLELCCNLSTTDLGIPVVITLSLDTSGAGPASVIAARADFDVESAVLRSREETAQTRLWARKLMRDRPDFAPEPGYTNITRGEDHVRLFCDQGMAEHLRFLTDAPVAGEIGSVEPPVAEDTRGRIGRCVETLASSGLEVIVVDVTTPDIAALGFTVVRVLIPGLQPLDMDFNWRYLGGTRLYEVPVKMGFARRKPLERDLNPVPHPFP